MALYYDGNLVTGTVAPDAWPSWTNGTTVTFTSSSTNEAWQDWTAASQVWSAWWSSAAPVTYVGGHSHAVYGGSSYAVEVSPEEQEKRRAEAAERVEKEKAAKERARKLLLTHLEDEQREELEQAGYFHVHTRDGERTYQLRPGFNPMRVKGEDGRRVSYCIHPSGVFPSDDTALALKLLLETDEERFLAIANATVLA